jgi:hypothetical protein
MQISEEEKIRITDRAESHFVEILTDFVVLHKSGVSQVGKCPKCGEDRGLSIHPEKQIFGCFKCNQIKGRGAIDYLLKGQDMGYLEAMKYVADKYCIEITDKSKRKPFAPVPPKKVRGKLTEEKYVDRMLRESGLTAEDVTTQVVERDDKKALFFIRTIAAGTLNSKGEVLRDGNDAIIYYYDLDGFPVKYELRGKNNQPTGTFKEYYRVRWQFPEEHLNKEGKPTKYKSPYQAGTFIYIPGAIRELYRKGEKIKRLFIQEGEKKAEKCCKHGVWSVGISGIMNLGQNGRIPEDLVKIIRTCGVEEVIFLHDSDWNDLSSDLKVSEDVAKRPRNFFYSVRNFKEYMRTLAIYDLYVEIYYGYVKKNEKNDKGIDDLLTNSLKGKETLLLDDIDQLFITKELAGDHLQLHKITSMSDHKIEEFWNLTHPTKFAEAHKDVLQLLPEFKIGKLKWRFNEEGELESAQPLESDEQFWEEVIKVDRNGNETTSYKFKYVRALRFLQNRGFARFRRSDNTFQFIHVTPPTVRTVDHIEVRDYVTEFAQAVAKEEVLELLIQGGPQYLGPDKISHLPYLQPNFENPTRDTQLFYFRESCFEITANSIKEIRYTEIHHQIWAEKKNDFQPIRLQFPLINIRQKEDGQFSYYLTEAGKKCHFLQFLINASNFTWRNEQKIEKEKAAGQTPSVEISPEDQYENVQHLISKLAAIGYMMLSAKDKSVARAVVAMDGKQSEVGASNGRSGKSLIGTLFENILPTVNINGKQKDMDGDTFLWDEVTEKTEIVVIDDTRQSFDLEFLFACITGSWAVNYKGGRRVTFPFRESPKIYISTNHAIKGEGSSFNDRQWKIAFSDFYNDQHKPTDDFGLLFFDEWDWDQWNLLWNLVAECVQVYLKYGVVQAPGDRIATRQLRQSMGETFLTWADEYFSNEEKINTLLARRELSDAFFAFAPEQRKFVTPTEFKKKIVRYCEWKELIFNPQRYDPITRRPAFFDKDGNPEIDNKTGGVEYFTLGEPSYWWKTLGDLPAGTMTFGDTSYYVSPEVKKPKFKLPNQNK